MTVERRKMTVERFLVVVGLFFLSFGVVVWFAPGTVPHSVLVSLDTRSDVARYSVAGFLLVVLLVGWLLTTRGSRSTSGAPVPPSRQTRHLRRESVEHQSRRQESRQSAVSQTATQHETGRERAGQSGAIQPGFDVDGRLTTVLSNPAASGRQRAELTADLRDCAIEVLCYYENDDETTATERLDTGAWTDDPLAASLFVERTHVSHSIRIRRWLLPRRTYRRQIQAAVDELSGLAER